MNADYKRERVEPQKHGDVIWRHGIWFTAVQVMAHGLATVNFDQNQCQISRKGGSAIHENHEIIKAGGGTISRVK